MIDYNKEDVGFVRRNRGVLIPSAALVIAVFMGILAVVTLRSSHQEADVQDPPSDEKQLCENRYHREPLYRVPAECVKYFTE